MGTIFPANDLVLFSHKRDILLTLIKCQTRMTIMQRLQSKQSGEAAEAIADCLKALPQSARKTITLDNGGEFARHTKLTSTLACRPTFVILTVPGDGGYRKRQWQNTTRAAKKNKTHRLHRGGYQCP